MCIDLLLAVKPISFLKSAVIETGLMDFYKTTLVIMKSIFQNNYLTMLIIVTTMCFHMIYFVEEVEQNVSPDP